MKNNIETQLAFRILKLWQSSDHQIILSLSAVGPIRHQIIAKKQFLVIDSRQANFGLYAPTEKPDFTIIKNPFVEIYRKHCDKASLIGIKQDPQNGDFWLELKDFAASKMWFISLVKSRPPEIALLDDLGTIYVRHGQHGTFTKKKPYHLEELNSKAGNFKEISLNVFAPYFLPGKTESSKAQRPPIEENEQAISEHNSVQRTLLSKLKRRLKTAQKAAESQQQNLPNQDEISKNRQLAELLQNYAYLVKSEDFELILQSDITGLDQDVVISLDPDLTVGGNIEAYFKKANKLKKAYAIGIEIKKKNLDHLQALKRDIEVLADQPLSEYELVVISQAHKIPLANSHANKISQASPTEAKPFKEYLSSTGHKVLVGKGPKENDELTKKAKANDYWLHTAGVTGSHVIIPATKDVRHKLPESLLKEAAILAIHYSKLKGDLAGEVYLAKKSEIKKQKGMPPGLWNVERCKTVFIRFTSDELKDILNRLLK